MSDTTPRPPLEELEAKIPQWKKICACIPFADADAGLAETEAAMRELITFAESAAALIRQQQAKIAELEHDLKDAHELDNQQSDELNAIIDAHGGWKEETYAENFSRIIRQQQAVIDRLTETLTAASDCDRRNGGGTVTCGWCGLWRFGGDCDCKTARQVRDVLQATRSAAEQARGGEA